MADNTIFAASAATIFDSLGVDATYTPVTGSPATVRVIKDKYPRFSGDGLPTAERVTVISVLQSEWPDNPVPGDVITIDTTDYAVLGLVDPYELPGSTVISDDDIEWMIKVR